MHVAPLILHSSDPPDQLVAIEIRHADIADENVTFSRSTIFNASAPFSANEQRPPWTTALGRRSDAHFVGRARKLRLSAIRHRLNASYSAAQRR
jgi:hypothetical protein